MTDLIEVSYTGDLLAHRRCPRAWAYEKHIGIHPYEQVQAMEGFLVHHAMQWLTDQHRKTGHHAGRDQLTQQLERYFLVLWARGIRTTFASKMETIERVVGHLYQEDRDEPQPEVKAAVEGAQHEEYPLRSVRRVKRELYGGKSKVLLTGVLDVVVQQKSELVYPLTWRWTDKVRLEGEVTETPDRAAAGDQEIWDYKGTRLRKNNARDDYVRQVATYAALLQDRIGLPKRCVLFFTNEKPGSKRRLLSIPIDQEVVEASINWTLAQVQELRQTVLQLQRDPLSVEGGDLTKRGLPLGDRVDDDLQAQCTACSQRFDCSTYRAHLSKGRRPGTGSVPPDVDLLNVAKN
ncbi:PD-(D/E)XK nuclease family protein [Micromonospora purpureochromogenes]|uniref:PD-(D/E)XK nuclease family protein n=1 Tax=Micromonospora purpureochromogenes TaxID=47872 RepID=UPI0036336E1F